MEFRSWWIKLVAGWLGICLTVSDSGEDDEDIMVAKWAMFTLLHFTTTASCVLTTSSHHTRAHQDTNILSNKICGPFSPLKLNTSTVRMWECEKCIIVFVLQPGASVCVIIKIRADSDSTRGGGGDNKYPQLWAVMTGWRWWWSSLNYHHTCSWLFINKHNGRLTQSGWGPSNNQYVTPHTSHLTPHTSHLCSSSQTQINNIIYLLDCLLYLNCSGH